MLVYLVLPGWELEAVYHLVLSLICSHCPFHPFPKSNEEKKINLNITLLIRNIQNTQKHDEHHELLMNNKSGTKVIHEHIKTEDQYLSLILQNKYDDRPASMYLQN